MHGDSDKVVSISGQTKAYDFTFVAGQAAVDRLAAVRIDDPSRRARQHPYQFSGGMRQRAMVGMGLMASPALLIADEPTTALDVTVQRQVLDLIDAIRAQDGVAVILISHDVSVVAERCDRVLVMYAGRIVEELPADRLAGALHPYTRLLVAAVPDFTTDLTRPLAVIPGGQPEPTEVPPGCAFAGRCPLADSHCGAAQPQLVASALGRVACFHAGEFMPTAVSPLRETRSRTAVSLWTMAPTRILGATLGAGRDA
jgi:oligopeptide/dipeptide ABC transporter ATP-binding protein